MSALWANYAIYEYQNDRFFAREGFVQWIMQFKMPYFIMKSHSAISPINCYS